MLLFDGERLNELYATGFVIKMFIKFYTFFFFSSRRRHTRSLRDWSSDVCSSDLSVKRGIRPVSSDSPRRGSRCRCDFRSGEIGRASCRERVLIWVDAVAVKNKIFACEVFNKGKGLRCVVMSLVSIRTLIYSIH